MGGGRTAHDVAADEADRRPRHQEGRHRLRATRVSLQLQQGFSTGIAGVSRGLPVDGKAWWAGRISPASARAGWVGMQLLEWLREAV